jgi:hypothetical protein
MELCFIDTTQNTKCNSRAQFYCTKYVLTPYYCPSKVWSSTPGASKANVSGIDLLFQQRERVTIVLNKRHFKILKHIFIILESLCMLSWITYFGEYLKQEIHSWKSNIFLTWWDTISFSRITALLGMTRSFLCITTITKYYEYTLNLSYMKPTVFLLLWHICKH